MLCSDRRLFVSLVSLQNEIALHAFLQRKREMIINDCLLSILKVNDSMNESAKQPIINTNITRIQKREKNFPYESKRKKAIQIGRQEVESLESLYSQQLCFVYIDCVISI